MLEERLIELEIKIAYQEDLMLSLNHIIATQQQQIDRLEATSRLLQEKLKSLQPPDELQDMHQIPPHY